MDSHRELKVTDTLKVLGVKHLGYEADDSPPSSAEVKNKCSSTSVPSICLPGMYRDKFTFHLLYTRRTGIPLLARHESMQVLLVEHIRG
jgi:hypothetical protein